MRFSKVRKFIYLANPKTGSTSVRSMLDSISDHKKLIKKKQYHDHWSAQEYKLVFKKNGLNWDDYYVFTTIRNPWAKYLSNYFFSKPDNNFAPFYYPQYNPKTEFKYDFDDWIKYYIVEMNRFPPGCPPLRNFAYAKDSKCLVNDIFPIESFNRIALPRIINKLSLDNNTCLPWLNKTSKSNYRHYYNDELAALISITCDLDIEIGQYTF